MDILQDYTPHLLTLYTALLPYLLTLRRLYLSLQLTLTPYLLPLLDRFAVFAQESPAIISAGLLILLLLISVQVLNFARRVVVFWTRILVKVVFYAALVVLGVGVWQRGVGRSVEDVGRWAGEVAEVWWREYKRWEGMREQGVGGGGKMDGSRYGVRGGNAGTTWR